jgi:hypothetical protein
MRPLDWNYKNSNAKMVEVEGIKVFVIESVPSMVNLEIEGELIDGKSQHSVSFHFEYNSKGEKGISPESTPFWIALSKKLVDFYGGKIDYKDTDLSDLDYEVKSQRRYVTHETWQKNENAKFAIKPLTIMDLKEVENDAAFSVDETVEWNVIEKRMDAYYKKEVLDLLG